MTLSEGQTADLGTLDHAGPGLSSAEPVFSDLIDRWLNEGDRLNEAAGTADPSAPGDSPTQLDGWKWRARELVGAAMGRYRLPTLVGIGLVPLALMLLVAGRGEPRVSPPPVQAAQAAPAAPPPRAVLAEPPMTVLAPRPVPAVSVAALRAKPEMALPAKPVVVAKRPAAHPARVVARTSPAVKPAPTPVTKAVTPPPLRPVVAAPAKVQPQARPAAGTKIASKTTFSPDARVAPNLKLGSPARR